MLNIEKQTAETIINYGQQYHELLGTVEKYRKALEEIRTTVKITYEETAIERRKIAEKALGYMP